jgi:arylsulfatase A
MNTPTRLSTALLILAAASALPARAATPPTALAASHPNILYILCDDLGIGDIHAFNLSRGKIATPHVDALAAQGMSFTDAHSADSVCTPSRYGILTGRYAWRTHLQKGVLNGMTSKPLIADSQLTVPSFLKAHGYETAIIGKWHLGLGTGEGAKEFTDPLTDGPLQHGFDYFFGISASLDMPPFVYIENQKFTEVPTTTKKWGRTGPAAADFDAINVLPDLTHKAEQYIAGHAADAKSGKPFFLYLAFSAPHTPILPTPEWQGKSHLGPYGDFVMEVDDCTGKVLKALDDAGVADNTLVVFTSDNGCSPAANVKLLESEGHYPSADYRGYKADIWDGGHRIPFIARWPGKIQPASHTSQLTCLTDLFATVADIYGEKLPDNAAEDSVSMLPVLTGAPVSAPDSQRQTVVHHSIDGYFAIREGKWKLELCAGSGGWAAPREYAAEEEKLPMTQLYDMDTDEGETQNVAADHPDVVKDLTALLDKYIADGRSTPGPDEPNDAKIVVRKKPVSPKEAAATKAIGD